MHATCHALLLYRLPTPTKLEDVTFYRATPIHSVARCLSVCPSHAGILSKRMYISSKLSIEWPTTHFLPRDASIKRGFSHHVVFVCLCVCHVRTFSQNE